MMLRRGLVLYPLFWVVWLAYIVFILYYNGKSPIYLLALYLSGTYCQKTGTRPPSCAAPRQPTIYLALWSSAFSEIFCTIVKVRFGPLGLELRPRALLF